MLDNLLNSVRRGAERVQRRGEEVAQVTRLRLEAFQLSRELDSAYARLGRAYHAGGDMELLQGVRADIRRIEEEITARERLITELGGDPKAAEGSAPGRDAGPVQSSPVDPAQDNRPSFVSENTPAQPGARAAGAEVQASGHPGTGIPGLTEPTIPDATPRPHDDPADRLK
ncbi:hypothetical protein [Deinococcus navajonensis]|uniref:Uncharacterized protein n=1 Tax=Deinococcus navajonensis TaxID=309884 RepID=A0ABV8XQ60_9DEIO